MKHGKKIIDAVGVIFLIILALTVAPAPAKEKVLIVGDNANHRSLDSASIGVTQDIQISRAIYQGLLRYKKNSFEFEGDLAKSWTVSKDGLTYTFKLRDGINWQKGFGKFTAADVKYTFDRLLDPKTGAANRSEFVADIQEVRAPDDMT
ncbi:MAG TPA: ABC transporter substrate-binding protein, partial [Thermodesulfobacteriota bacterium]|nr:ABC transporter substrate-binding protein [Thermodesulfobacteriota bacterium]